MVGMTVKKAVSRIGHGTALLEMMIADEVRLIFT